MKLLTLFLFNNQNKRANAITVLLSHIGVSFAFSNLLSFPEKIFLAALC